MKNSLIIILLFISTILGIIGTLFVVNFDQIIGVEIIKFNKSIRVIEDVYEPYKDLSFRSHSMDTTELVMYVSILDSLVLELNNSYEYFVNNTKNIKHIPVCRSECLRIEERIINGKDRFLSVYNIIKIYETIEKINDIN